MGADGGCADAYPPYGLKPAYFCVMAGALRLPALRVETGVYGCASWRVRCAYPPYGLKPAYIFVRRVGKRERTHRASELTLR